MVALNHTVDSNNTETGFALMEPGVYRADIVDIQVKTSKSNASNQYLELQLKTDRGSVWDRLNLWNSNPKAVDMAYATLNQIGVALGMGQINDTDQLIAKSLNIQVGIEPGTDGYKDKNVVEAYLPMQNSAPRPAAPAPAPAPAPSQGAAPWA